MKVSLTWWRRQTMRPQTSCMVWVGPQPGDNPTSRTSSALLMAGVSGMIQSGLTHDDLLEQGSSSAPEQGFTVRTKAATHVSVLPQGSWAKGSKVLPSQTSGQGPRAKPASGSQAVLAVGRGWTQSWKITQSQTNNSERVPFGAILISIPCNLFFQTLKS